MKRFNPEYNENQYKHLSCKQINDAHHKRQQHA